MIEVIYKFQCDICHKEHIQEGTILFDIMPKPNKPKGWTKINNNHYCPDHEVIVNCGDADFIKYNSKESNNV